MDPNTQHLTLLMEELAETVPEPTDEAAGTHLSVTRTGDGQTNPDE